MIRRDSRCASRRAESGARVDANADIDRQRLSENGLFPPNCWDLPGTTSPTSGCKRATPSIGGASSATPWKRPWTRRMRPQADRSAAALDAGQLHRRHLFRLAGRSEPPALARERRPPRSSREGEITAARVEADLDAADNINRFRPRAGCGSGTDRRARGIREAARGGVGGAGRPFHRRIAAAAPLSPCPRFPATLPDDVKIDLISRRADITASRWRVEAAERNLDSARAEFFPDVSINALAGAVEPRCRQAARIRQPGAAGEAAIHLPIFDAGRLKARYGGAQAAIDSAVSSYQDTLISAARDVATQATTRAQIAGAARRSAASRSMRRSSCRAARPRASVRGSPIRAPS